MDDIVNRVEAQYDDGHVDVRLARELVAEILRARAEIRNVVDQAAAFERSVDALVHAQKAEIDRLRSITAQSRLKDATIQSRPTIRDQVSEFHRAFGQSIEDKPMVPAAQIITLRVNLIAEEFCEMLEAVYGDDDGIHAVREAIKNQVAYGNIRVDMVEFADALADLAYVIEGANLAFGIDSGAVLAVVHAANMRKLGPDGKPIVRADGKRLKPEGWRPPDVAGELRRQGWSA